jgi:hypothetical protein
MRSVHVLALLSAVAAVVVLVYVPGCLGPFVEPWPPGKYRTPREQEVSLRRTARQTREILREKHREEPLEKWPEHERRLWRDAGAILGED